MCRGEHQSRDLGENLRKELLLLNKEVLDDVSCFSSSERRVVSTAHTFLSAFLNKSPPLESYIKISKEMLDDSNAAKEQVEVVKIKLYNMVLNTEDSSIIPPHFLEDFVYLLNRTREVMRKNFAEMNIEIIQKKWCCHESPALFRERWERLFKEICDVDLQYFDISKVSELYDSLKYDAYV